MEFVSRKCLWKFKTKDTEKSLGHIMKSTLPSVDLVEHEVRSPQVPFGHEGSIPLPLAVLPPQNLLQLKRTALPKATGP